jgi:hypothetical protein
MVLVTCFRHVTWYIPLRSLSPTSNFRRISFSDQIAAEDWSMDDSMASDRPEERMTLADGDIAGLLERRAGLSAVNLS